MRLLTPSASCKCWHKDPLRALAQGASFRTGSGCDRGLFAIRIGDRRIGPKTMNKMRAQSAGNRR